MTRSEKPTEVLRGSGEEFLQLCAERAAAWRELRDGSGRPDLEGSLVELQMFIGRPVVVQALGGNPIIANTQFRPTGRMRAGGKEEYGYVLDSKRPYISEAHGVLDDIAGGITRGVRLEGKSRWFSLRLPHYGFDPLDTDLRPRVVMRFLD